MSRIPELGRDELDAEGQQLYDQILAARGSIAGPFRVWLYSPEFTRRATQLGEFLRYHTSLSPRLSELVILITARRQASEVEWAIHKPLARKAGPAVWTFGHLKICSPDRSGRACCPVRTVRCDARSSDPRARVGS
jgi:4-carboxymuconolactone decarboxylase